MGADGGVCYVPMRNPSSKARALELLSPFYGLLGKCPWSDSRGDQTDAWECAHPEVVYSNNYIMGYYGTGQDIDLGDLAEMFRDVVDFDDLVPDPSLTFGELLEDLQTRPMFDQSKGGIYYLSSSHQRWAYDIKGREMSCVEYMLWEFFGWCANFDGEYAAFNQRDFAPIRDMKVVDWAREIERLCRWGSFTKEETWT